MPRKSPKHNLQEMEYGSLRVLHITELKNGNWHWMTKCVCGNKKEVIAHDLIRGYVRSCGCRNFDSGSKSPCWKGYGEISGSFWYHIQKSAANRDINFQVTIEFGWNLFLLQNRRCAISGMDISFATTNSNRLKGLCTASLDRKNSNDGYNNANVQWVHKDVNRMKSNLPESYFINVCKRITEFNSCQPKKD